MSDVVRQPLAKLFSRRNKPVIVEAVRSAAAATLAYAAALWLLPIEVPLLAPLTALLVVQVTLFTTVTASIRRVYAVLAGVTVAIAFSALIGLSWWSLGLLLLIALATGHLVRAGEYVPEVAISAMLVLGLTPQAEATLTAVDRVLETLLGAVVGMLFNAVIVPPVWVGPAGESIKDLAKDLRGLLMHIGDELGAHTPVEEAVTHLRRARKLDHDVAEVDVSLTQAEDSLRLNPRVSEGLLSRLVLRTGLDTLEACTVILRTMSGTMKDLAEKRTEEPLFPSEVAAAMEDLFTHLANAVSSFAVLISTQVSASADEAEARLIVWLEAARAERERVAYLLLDRVREHPRQWQLHGSLLTEIDRMLSELDVEKRSMRLAEELDRSSRARRERFPRLYRLGRKLMAYRVFARRRAGER